MSNTVTWKETWQNISADKGRYYGRWKTHAGFWVTFAYRIRRLRKFGPGWCKLLLPLDICAELVRRFLSDSSLPSNMEIGAGLYLPHPSGVIVNDFAVIGANVNLFQHVTIGEWHGGYPVLKDNCELFAGARVFGDITIGEGAKVGANAVLTQDLPDYHVAYPQPVATRPIK